MSHMHAHFVFLQRATFAVPSSSVMPPAGERLVVRLSADTERRFCLHCRAGCQYTVVVPVCRADQVQAVAASHRPSDEMHILEQTKQRQMIRNQGMKRMRTHETRECSITKRMLATGLQGSPANSSLAIHADPGVGQQWSDTPTAAAAGLTFLTLLQLSACIRPELHPAALANSGESMGEGKHSSPVVHGVEHISSPMMIVDEPDCSSSGALPTNALPPSFAEDIESLVLDQLTAIQRDLASGTIQCAKSSWIDAAWLLAITASKLPPRLEKLVRTLIAEWRTHVMRHATSFDAIDEQMFETIYDEPIASAPPVVRDADEEHALSPQQIAQLESTTASLAERVQSIDAQIAAMRQSGTAQKRICAAMCTLADECKSLTAVLIRACIPWHRTPGPMQLESDQPSAMRRAFRSLTSTIWHPLHEQRTLSRWLRCVEGGHTKLRRDVEQAVEQVLYLLTHCVYGMNLWGRKPEVLLDVECNRDAIGLPALAAIISDPTIERWLIRSNRIELLAEVITVHHAVGQREHVGRLWRAVLDMTTVGSYGLRREALWHIEGAPLNGTARVHLVNCLLLAFVDLVDLRATPDSRLRIERPQSRKRSIEHDRIAAQPADQDETSESKRQKLDDAIEDVPSRVSDRPTLNDELAAVVVVRDGQFTGRLRDMTDSTSLLHGEDSNSKLVSQLQSDGFLLLRGVVDPSSLRNIHREALAVASLSRYRRSTSTKKTAKKQTQNAEQISDLHLTTQLSEILVTSADAKTITAPGSALHLLLTRALVRTCADEDASDESTELVNRPTASVTFLREYTWLRGKLPGRDTRPHADYSHFQHRTSFFADFVPAAAATRRSNPDDESATSPSTAAEVVRCHVCRGSSSASSLRARLDAKQLRAIRTGVQKWHCATCADAETDLWTCWIALVSCQRDEPSTLSLSPTSFRSMCGNSSRLLLLPGRSVTRTRRQPPDRDRRLPSLDRLRCTTAGQRQCAHEAVVVRATSYYDDDTQRLFRLSGDSRVITASQFG
jgi:hypothetical protein